MSKWWLLLRVVGWIIWFTHHSPDPPLSEEWLSDLHRREGKKGYLG